MSQNESNITKKTRFEALELSRIFSGMYEKKATQTAEFKQKVVSIMEYPSITVQNSNESNPFSMEEFDDTEKQTYENASVRVAWVKVPKGTTEEQVKAKLKDKPHFIRQVISNHPILTAQQENAIANGVTTKEAIAESQIVRYPKGHEEEGEIVLHTRTNKPMYKENYLALSNGKLQDEDLRTESADDFYLPESLSDELSVETVQDVQGPQALNMDD